MDLIEKVRLLLKIPLLSKIGPSNAVQLASSIDISKFDAGQTLFRQGDVGEEAFIILSGKAEVITEGPEGEVAVATVEQHQFIGEIAILIDVPRTATVVASTDMTTLVISKQTFYDLLAEYPVVGIEVMRELARRLLDTTVQVTKARSDIETIQLFG